eukprot:2380052-Amphidinium_carterae.1
MLAKWRSEGFQADDALEIEAWPCMDCWSSPEQWDVYIRFRMPRGDFSMAHCGHTAMRSNSSATS